MTDLVIGGGGFEPRTWCWHGQYAPVTDANMTGKSRTTDA